MNSEGAEKKMIVLTLLSVVVQLLIYTHVLFRLVLLATMWRLESVDLHDHGF